MYIQTFKNLDTSLISIVWIFTELVMLKECPRIEKVIIHLLMSDRMQQFGFV